MYENSEQLPYKGFIDTIFFGVDVFLVEMELSF